MILTPLAKAKKKLRTRDVDLISRKLIDPNTGELISAFAPAHPVDVRSCRERGIRIGQVFRSTLRRERNPRFYRKAHVLSGWLADNVEAFHGLSQHDALKKLQELSGIGCESVEYDLPGIGKLTRTEPESLNFFDMDEGRWNELWSGGTGDGGWIGWLRTEVFGGLDAASREAVELIIQKPQGGA
jgi:hypothetical protein